MSDYLNDYEYLRHDLGIDMQMIDVNEVLSEGSYKEKERIIKMLENKMNSIPFKIGQRSDRIVIRKTIVEVINVLKRELDEDYKKIA